MELKIEETKVPNYLRQYFEPALCGSCYICHLVEICREIKRVMRKDGVFFINIGDSYAGSGCGTNDYRTEASRSINKSDAM